MACSRWRGGAACSTELLDLRNSGDTAGDRARVVGYAALALYEPTAARLSKDDEVAAAVDTVDTADTVNTGQYD